MYGLANLHTTRTSTLSASRGSQAVSQQGQFHKQISNLSWAKSSSKIAVGDCITLTIKNSTGH